MASSVVTTSVDALPAERFFRGSLLFLILSSIATLIATGKLDTPTCVLASAAMAFKGYRWLFHKPTEITQPAATLLVLGYLAFFPFDVFFFSRALAASSANPALYAALLGAVHFLLFVMLVRLYSATSDRDAFFLSMLAFAAVLAAAILTIDTSFLILFFVFLLFGVSTFVEIKKNATVVMRVKTGKAVGYPLLRWRGIALSTFDGKRWTTPHHHGAVLQPDSSGWIYVADPEQRQDGPAIGLNYEIFLQPIATDTVFAPSNAISVQGNFAGENLNAGWMSRRSYLFRDAGGSLYNPFRNYSPVRYFGFSRLPAINATRLRNAPDQYTDEMRAQYLQL